MADFTAKALGEIKKLGATHIWYTGIIEHATQMCIRDSPRTACAYLPFHGRFIRKENSTVYDLLKTFPKSAQTRDTKRPQGCF